MEIKIMEIEVIDKMSADMKALLIDDRHRPVKSYCSTADALEQLGLQDEHGQYTELGFQVLQYLINS